MEKFNFWRVDKMKRYWLFGGSYYYPSGGMADFKGSFDSALEAEKYAAIESNDFDWWHVFDSLLAEACSGCNNPLWDNQSDPHELAKQFDKFW